jgi:hypothetical protein
MDTPKGMSYKKISFFPTPIGFLWIWFCNLVFFAIEFS